MLLRNFYATLARLIQARLNKRPEETELMLPGRFFSPHQTDLSTYIGLIKRAKNEVCPVGNARIRGHLGQQGGANTIGNHLNSL